MSIIQTIRDRGARIAVFLIALALTGFILTDYLTGRSSSLFSGGPGTTLGKVNGEKIEQPEFAKKLDMATKSKQNSEPLTASVNELWDQEVDRVLVEQECRKLGITVGDKEKSDLLYGQDPHPYIRQFFYGQQSDQPYDASAVFQAISQINKSGTADQKAQWSAVYNAAISDRMIQKYKNLIAGSIHYPKWLLEKQNVDNSLVAKVSYVFVPSTVISDSAKELAVSDKEISDFINKRKSIYTLQDEIRTVDYVRFDAVPSQADSTTTFNQLAQLKDSFAHAKNVEGFLTRFGSAYPYDSTYHPQSKIMVPAKDSIFKLAKDQVYGPYLDASTTQSNYVLAKLIDVRYMPDSVKARHILIQTADPRQGKIILDDSIAKRRIDSIELALKNGARFDSLAKKLSDDKGSGALGGLLRLTTERGDSTDYFTQGQMVKEFNDSAFLGKVGEIKKVRTAFGWHLIEILDQRHFETNYKVAYFAKNIEASEETDQTTANNAMSFAGEAQDVKSFEAAIQKHKLQKLTARDISSHAYELAPGLVSRDFIRDVFDADKNEVMKTATIADQKRNNVYVIAVVTEINKPGLISVAKARPIVEPELKRIKKGQLIKKQIGTPSSLESVVDLVNNKYHPVDTIRIVTEDSLRFNPQRASSRIAGEQRLIGAAFNPSNNNKLIAEPIIGNNGNVYVAKVEGQSAVSVENANVNAQRQSMEMQSRQQILFSFSGFQQGYDPAAILRKVATIKDYRSKFNY